MRKIAICEKTFKELLLEFPLEIINENCVVVDESFFKRAISWSDNKKNFKGLIHTISATNKRR